MPKSGWCQNPAATGTDQTQADQRCRHEAEHAWLRDGRAAAGAGAACAGLLAAGRGNIARAGNRLITYEEIVQRQRGERIGK